MHHPKSATAMLGATAMTRIPRELPTRPMTIQGHRTTWRWSRGGRRALLAKFANQFLGRLESRDDCDQRAARSLLASQSTDASAAATGVHSVRSIFEGEARFITVPTTIPPLATVRIR